jgi:hypothetical protein
MIALNLWWLCAAHRKPHGIAGTYCHQVDLNVTGWERYFKSMVFDFHIFLFTELPQFSNTTRSEINQNPIEADAFSLGFHWFSGVIYRGHILEVGIQAEGLVKCWRKT